MAMTNLNQKHYNEVSQTNILSHSEPSPKQSQSTNYNAGNISNLSPIYEGEVFSSPTNTISPSISHCHIDGNHVVLFNNNLLSQTMSTTNSNSSSSSTTTSTPTTTTNNTTSTPSTSGSHHSNNNESYPSPTTSISSSNSSNTPTPTAFNNSLFSIPPSTNNNPPCIPNVGGFSIGYNPKNGALISNTSTSSSSPCMESPSPSLDTTVSPVTKMDFFNRDLKIFEDVDTDDNIIGNPLNQNHDSHHSSFIHNSFNPMIASIDYLTGDKHCDYSKIHKHKKKKKKSKHHHNHHHHDTDSKEEEEEDGQTEDIDISSSSATNTPNSAHIHTHTKNHESDHRNDTPSDFPPITNIQHHHQIPSPLNTNSIIDHQLIIDKLSLDLDTMSPKHRHNKKHHHHHHHRKQQQSSTSSDSSTTISTPTSKRKSSNSSSSSSSSSHRHHSKHHHESRRKRKKRRKHIEAGYSDSDSELSKGKIKDKIKKISIRVPGDPNGLYKHWKRSKSLFKKRKSSPTMNLNIFNEDEAEDINTKDLLNIDESCKLNIEHQTNDTYYLQSNPLFTDNHHRKLRQYHQHHHHHHHEDLEQIEMSKKLKIKKSDHNVQSDTIPIDDTTQLRLPRDRLNSYPPNNLLFTFKSPGNLSSPSSSMSNTSMSNCSVIPMLKKSQSMNNLSDEKIARHNVKLDEYVLTNKAIIIHTPKTSKDDNTSSQSMSSLQPPHVNNSSYHYNNYNFSVLGLKSYQNKKKHKENNNHIQKSYGYNIMSNYSKSTNITLPNRIRVNSFPPYSDNYNAETMENSQNLLPPQMTKIRVPSIASSTTSCSILTNQSPLNTHTSDSNKSSPSLRDILKHNIVIERVERKPPNNDNMEMIHQDDDSKEDRWHYTNKQHTKVYGMDQYHAKRKNGRDNGQYEPFYYRNHSTKPPSSASASASSLLHSSSYLNPYYHPSNITISPQPQSIPIYKWNNDENDSSPNITPMLQIESLSEPNPAYFHLNNHNQQKYDHKQIQKSKRKRKNISDSSPRHIHPSMNHHRSSKSHTPSSMTNSSNLKAIRHKNKHLSPNHSSPNDSEILKKKKLRNSPKNKLEIVAPEISGGTLVDL